MNTKPQLPFGSVAVIVGLLSFALLGGNADGCSVAPNPVPLPGDGLRVLIVEEVDDRTLEIAEVVNGEAVRNYLDSHCGKGDDGRPNYRVLDDDTKQENLPQVWRDALKLAEKTPEPAIVVTNGRDGFVGPLPLPAGETLKLLKRYGGD